MNSNDPILRVDNLNISFVNKKGENRTIVENGNFVVYPGEIVLIVGENGSVNQVYSDQLFRILIMMKYQFVI